MKKWIILCVLFTVFHCPASDILYLGVQNDGCASIRGRIDHQILENLLVQQKLLFIDDRTHHLVEQRLASQAPPLSPAKIVRETEGVLSDTTLIVWLSIPDCSIDLERAWRKLIGINSRWGMIAAMKLYFGLSAEEIGRQLNISEHTVNNLWPKCRQFLTTELAKHRRMPLPK